MAEVCVKPSGAQARQPRDLPGRHSSATWREEPEGKLHITVPDKALLSNEKWFTTALTTNVQDGMMRKPSTMHDAAHQLEVNDEGGDTRRTRRRW